MATKPKTSAQLEAEAQKKRAQKYEQNVKELNDNIKIQLDKLKTLTPGSSEYEVRMKAVKDLTAARDKALVDVRLAYTAQAKKEADSKPEFVGPDKYSPNPVIKSKSGKSSGTNVGMGGAISCLFNAPLISQTNFRGIQAQILSGNFISAGNFDDALNSFKIDNNTGEVIVGKGAIQADRYTRNAVVSGQFGKPIATYNNVIDENIYGFKFHYNPQTVSMTWGSLAATDPVYQASGQDPYNPGTSNLTASNIEFSLVLNRIEDFNYIDGNGLKIIAEGTTVSNNPYSGFSRLSELKEIYEEGTMYDLKFLFRTMHGQGAYATYRSSLMNQVTADPGWLPVRPVELHLGNKMRYRVRISGLSINHTIFTPRMIPVLTTVNITCSRYWDDVGGIGTAQ